MIFLPISVLLLLFGVSIKEAYAAGNTTYVVALLGQDIQNDTVNPDINYELVLSTNSTSSISVDVTGIDGLITTLTVDDTGKTVHTLDQTKGMNGSEYSNKSIIVHSADGFFTLQVFITRGDHNYIEGFLGIPIQSLAGPNQPVGQTVYSYVAATFCDVGGYCQLAVAALNDKTAVSIVLPSHVEEIVCCKGKGYHRSKRDTAFTLNKFDSIQFESTYDLTGTVIYSFEPIVVFAGSRNVSNGEVIAHTVEQLVPSSHWGTEYVVTNLGTNGYGDILKIVSHWSDTKITMKGFPSFILKNRYQTAVRRLDKGFSSHIQASHPIQVVQITGLTYATENETSTLSMTVVPSVQNAYTEPVTVACHGAAAQQAQFYIVTGNQYFGRIHSGCT
ncbi:IgGFc-binding protein-like [Mercenaria mercenaria]|uniref:IgGFc-binding protein-like n=1 Tax=Mercenaria mercenaria TaxID=6596 RepID=UPI00234EC4EC|nr:IgGFc-binding protein-like [Mercenaria mercenaria]